MANYFDELTFAIEQHKQLKSAIDKNANALADLLSGNLKAVSPWRLEKLKKQLRDFNMHTGRWTK